MRNDIDDTLINFSGNEPAPKWAINAVEQELGHRLPDDYRTFMERFNGGEGFIGNQYLILWRVEEILPFNHDYEVNQYAPGILLFASNGGGEAFGFDMRSEPWPVVQAPFVGLELRYAKRVANDFIELLLRMSESDGSLL